MSVSNKDENLFFYDGEVCFTTDAVCYLSCLYSVFDNLRSTRLVFVGSCWWAYNNVLNNKSEKNFEHHFY